MSGGRKKLHHPDRPQGDDILSRACCSCSAWHLLARPVFLSENHCTHLLARGSKTNAAQGGIIALVANDEYAAIRLHGREVGQH